MLVERKKNHYLTICPRSFSTEFLITSPFGLCTALNKLNAKLPADRERLSRTKSRAALDKTLFRVFRGNRIVILRRQPLRPHESWPQKETRVYQPVCISSFFHFAIFRNSFSSCLGKLVSIRKNDFFKVPVRCQPDEISIR